MWKALHSGRYRLLPIAVCVLGFAVANAAELSTDRWSGDRDSDSAWAPIRQIVDALEAGTDSPGGGLFDPGGVYAAWQESSARTLVELGLHFYERFPEDPRRWVWFVATLRHAPSYADDDEAARAWTARRAEIAEALYADPETTELQRGDVYYYVEFRERYRRDRDAADAGEPVDWSAWQDEIVRTGERYPGYNPVGRARTMCRSILRATRKWAPESLPGFIAELTDSPNTAMRELALAWQGLARARETPVELSFTALDGRDVDLAELRGKVVLVDFWASTWCAWCHVENPVLKKLYDRYRDDGFEIVGITLELKPESRRYLERYIRRNGIDWPQYFDGKGMDNPYARQFGVLSIPQYLLLNQDGLLVADRKEMGGIRGLEPRIRELLELGPLAEDALVEMPQEYRGIPQTGAPSEASAP